MATMLAYRLVLVAAPEIPGIETQVVDVGAGGTEMCRSYTGPV
jgi:hypothetical protein